MHEWFWSLWANCRSHRGQIHGWRAALAFGLGFGLVVALAVVLALAVGTENDYLMRIGFSRLTS
jgi:hypothetical protein